MLLLSKPGLFCLLVGYVFNGTKVGHQDVAPTRQAVHYWLMPQLLFFQTRPPSVAEAALELTVLSKWS